MTGGTILESRAVTKRFGDFIAVEEVSYRLAEGETAGIIGPNGAGKSTFFNLLSGMYPPTAGTVSLRGEDVTALPADARVARGLVRTFQLVSVFDSLPVLENLLLSATRFSPGYGSLPAFFLGPLRTSEAERAAREALERVGLSARARDLTADLSYGEKRKLEIAMALTLKPAVLLLDEPLAGLSDVEITEVLDLVSEVRRGLTLVIIEHKISRILDLVSRLSVMHEGRLIAEGPPREILCNPEVRRVYWGEAPVCPAPESSDAAT